MKVDKKKIIIVSVGICFIFGIFYWFIFDINKRKSFDKTTSFLIDKRVKHDYRERMDYIADIYYSMMINIEERTIEERKERIKKAREELVNEGYISVEEEKNITDEEVIILLEEILMKTKNETE